MVLNFGTALFSVMSIIALGERIKFKWSPRAIVKENTRGIHPEQLDGVCLRPKTLTPFLTMICDFHYPLHDLIKQLISYL